MTLARLPAELLHETLVQLAPESLDWSEKAVEVRWFLSLRRTCSRFDNIIVGWLLSTIKTGEHLDDLPLIRNPLRPSAVAATARLLIEQAQRDRQGSKYSLIHTILDGAAAATDLLVPLVPQETCMTALVSTIIGFSGTYAPLSHLAEKDEEETHAPEEGDRHNLALLVAASVGSIEGMKRLIGQGADVNFDKKDSWIGPPLFAAAMAGQTAAVQFLLDSGASPATASPENGDTALHYAAYAGRVATVTLLLGTGVDPDRRNNQDETALTWAAAAGRVEMTRMLLAQETDINAVDKAGKTPLLYAVWRGFDDVARLLLAHPDVNPSHKDSETENMTPLAAAAFTGSEELFQILLARADVDPSVTDDRNETILKHAAVGGNRRIVEAILELPQTDVNAQGSDGSTPLMWAAKEGYEEIVRLLLAREDLQVNVTAEQGLTALMMAVVGENRAIIQAVLEHKDLQVNATCDDSEELEGNSTLGLVVGNGDEEIARLLLGHPDIDPEVRDMYGRTPLARAALEGHVGMTKLLLSRKDVFVNAKDYSGETPLLLAAAEGEELVVQCLLERDDIEVTMTNDDGFTALTVAASEGYERIVRILLDPNRGYDKSDIQRALECARENGHAEVQRVLSAELASLARS